MKKNSIKPKLQSRPFKAEELFFSTTDAKGIITSCNEVFIRVSGFESSELLGKPHNIIRHPDMPRCVFKLLWEYLLEGKAIGAFVKNLAQTGEYYWVFALAAPIENGFLSLRLKPTSPLLETVEPLYCKLLAVETSYGANWKEGMHASTLILLQALAELGFNTYDDFMNVAFMTELEARDRLLSVKEIDDQVANVTSQPAAERSFEMLRDLVSLKGELIEQKRFLVKAVEDLTLTSMNSAVRATRYGEEGRTLSVISSEIARTSESVSCELVSFNAHLSQLCESLQTATMDTCLAKLQAEVAQSFHQEGQLSQLNDFEQARRYGKPIDELENILIGRSILLKETACKSIHSLNLVLDHFTVMVEMFSKIVKTLRFAYITGKTEASRIAQGGNYITLLDHLNTFTGETEEKLRTLGQRTNKTRRTLVGL